MLRTFVLGIGALMLGAFGFIAYVAMRPPQKAAGHATEKVETMVTVIAAAHPIRAGSLLQPNDLGVRDVPESKLPLGARRDAGDTRNALVGAMVRRMLDDHEVISNEDVLRPGDRGFLAAVLAPGSRAISVAVDAVSGEAGLIWPGDRVDLLLTQTLEGADLTLAHRVSGETVLADVRVIAVDQQLVQGGQASGLLQGHEPTSRTITLEVTPRDSARIAVASRLGKLLVVLRSAEPDALATSDPVLIATPSSVAAQSATSAAGGTQVAVPAVAAAATAAPVWGSDVSRALGNDSAARQTELRLYQGTKEVEAYKF